MSGFRKFMKEWGFFILFMATLLLPRLFLWSPFLVSGHSMDPTLADGEYLLEVRYLPIDRFDIVVAKETDENGNEKRIVKRVIGMPGDTIKYENDQLYINGKKTDEPYLKNIFLNLKRTNCSRLILTGRCSSKLLNKPTLSLRTL